MRQSLDEILSVVYRFYARGVRQYDPGYMSSEEHRRLVQARLQAGAEGTPWLVLLDRLYGRLPEERIQNGSLHLHTGGFDAGYVGWFWLPPRVPYEKNHVIGFLISFLAPCYVVYSAAHVAVPDTKPQDWSRNISFIFSPDEVPSVRIIKEELLSVFPGYEPVPPELGNMIVPDLVDGSGPTGETTLFHCLFTDAW